VEIEQCKHSVLFALPSGFHSISAKCVVSVVSFDKTVGIKRDVMTAMMIEVAFVLAVGTIYAAIAMYTAEKLENDNFIVILIFMLLVVATILLTGTFLGLYEMWVALE